MPNNVSIGPISTNSQAFFGAIMGGLVSNPVQRYFVENKAVSWEDQ